MVHSGPIHGRRPHWLVRLLAICVASHPATTPNLPGLPLRGVLCGTQAFLRRTRYITPTTSQVYMSEEQRLRRRIHDRACAQPLVPDMYLPLPSFAAAEEEGDGEEFGAVDP